jgi:tRNA(adenine34) deaminase
MSFPLPPPMRRALDLAAEAAADGEVPVGAVVTIGGEIIAEARNAMRGSVDPTAHAEMVAIRAAAAKLGASRLDDCTLWVTLEPCAMCAAALAISRVKALRFAAEDPKGGGVVHGPRIFAQPTCHHAPEVLGGIGEAEAAAQLREFFAARR